MVSSLCDFFLVLHTSVYSGGNLPLESLGVPLGRTIAGLVREVGLGAPSCEMYSSGPQPSWHSIPTPIG